MVSSGISGGMPIGGLDGEYMSWTDRILEDVTGSSGVRGERLIVQIDGEYMFWMDGILEGNDALVTEARRLSRDKVEVSLPLGHALCDVDDPSNPAGAIAAMWGVNPERASILEGYSGIVNKLLRRHVSYGGNCIDDEFPFKLKLKQNISLFISKCRGEPKQIEISC